MGRGGSAVPGPRAGGGWAGDVMPPPPGEGTSGQRAGAYVAGGIGVLGLVVGGVMGGLTAAKKSVIEANCGLNGDPTLCNHEGKLAADSSKTTGLVSTV